MDLQIYDNAASLLRAFFRAKNYIEVNVQYKLSILAACEDPETISIFNFDGLAWPLVQTGQMHLENILLTNPDIEGVYCFTTSHRNERNPIPERHDLIFPMFEFEGRGKQGKLNYMLEDLVAFLNIDRHVYKTTYEHSCKDQGVSFIGDAEEKKLCTLFDMDGMGVTMLFDFPERSHPFWNMKKLENNLYQKIDVIFGGIETIGSAVREEDVDSMRERFFSISDGNYSGLLFKHFTEKRVMKELNEYLALPMTERFGGGIGMTRLVRYLEKLK